MPNNADILGQLADEFSKNTARENGQGRSKSEIYLASIDNTLKEMLRQSNNMSASNFRNAASSGNTSTTFRDRANNYSRTGSNGANNSSFSNTSFSDLGKDAGKKLGEIIDDFSEGVEQGIKDSLKYDFGDEIRKIFDEFADDLGMSIKDLPQAMGRILGQEIMPEGLSNRIDGITKTFTSDLKDSLKNLSDALNAEGKISHVNRATQSQTEAQAERFNANSNRGYYQSGVSTNIASIAESGFNDVKGLLLEIDYILGDELYATRAIVDSVADFEAQQNYAATSNAIWDEYNNIRNPQPPTQESEQSGMAGIAGTAQKLLTSGENALVPAGTQELGSVITTFTSTMGAASGSAMSVGSALLGVATTAAPLVLALAAITAASALLNKAFEDVKDAGNDFKKSLTSMITMQTSIAEQSAKNEAQRLKDDVETMLKEPYEIMRKAAEEAEQVWDNVLKTINATQGYTKSDLQDLMSNYAERLRNEGLTSVVSSTDITSNLQEVLKTGMSGAIAEEFAYVATVLNAAIPTQDFFQYGESYLTIASNALAAGKSQEEAIAMANGELYSFANSVLYASRELSSGFTTGLKDASSLLEYGTKIATTAGTGSASEIAGVFASVASMVGGIAPDLTNSVTQMMYDLAVGGNSTTLTALRSLAGLGTVDNTTFINQLANDPQSVFYQLFKGLGAMQTTSSATMELAEALSSVLGVEASVLERVDFSQLANAVASMDMSSAALSENMTLLASGETTTSAEALRMQQINEYMIDEGLAYVLDNEAARTIQQHMWDEEMNDALMENEYAVNLQGSALTFLETLSSTVKNLLKIFTGASFIENLFSSAKTIAYDTGLIEESLMAYRVGEGNYSDYLHLSTQKNYNQVEDISAMTRSLKASQTGSGYLSTAASTNNMGSSQYRWGSVGKSQYAALSGAYGSSGYTPIALSASTATIDQVNSQVEAMIGTAQEFAEAGKSYEEWAETSTKYGIAQSALGEALENAGYTETQVKQYFEDYSANAAADEYARRNKVEEEYWEMMAEKIPEQNELLETENQWLEDTYTLEEDYFAQEVELLTTTNATLDEIFKNNKDYYEDWLNYYINHTTYEASGYDYQSVEKIQKQEKDESDSAILTLVESLTSNIVDLSDPTVQQNALLSEIVKLVAVIVQQNSNGTSAVTLADTYSGLATAGIVKTS